jgi:hypothetical protein
MMSNLLGFALVNSIIVVVVVVAVVVLVVTLFC